MTSERIAWMVIEKPIPSSLYIVEAQQYIYFNYDSQTRTCNKCGTFNHIAKDCDVHTTTKPQDRENVVQLGNLMAFPNLPRSPSSQSMSSQLEDEDISRSTLSTDSEQEPSQPQMQEVSAVADLPAEQPESNVEFNITCKKCDYTSKSQSDIDAHMKQHTGEKGESDSYAAATKSPPKPASKIFHTSKSHITQPKSYEISASQPVTKKLQPVKSSGIIQKRALSLSPNNSSTSDSPVPQKKAANQTPSN